jgi:exosortase
LNSSGKHIATLPDNSSTNQSDQKFDYKEIVRVKSFPFAVILSITVLFVFWQFIQGLPSLWFSPDSAYSHGILVPILAGYIIVHRWEKLKAFGTQRSLLGAILLIPILYVAFVANRTSMQVVLSLMLVSCIGLCIWTLNGLKFALACLPAVLYLLFALPVWTLIIDKFTQPMQVISTQMSEQILKVLGYEIYKADSTTLLLSNFEMNVGAPCSGLKLIISLMALMVFFVLIADLKWWANMFLALFIIPLAVITNGVRIAMIGIVGNSLGADAGHQFHDYSGYISLVICFFVLQKVCRALGWK